jgi:hypothetical protein
MLETLEERTLLSNYTASSVSSLIADINAANQAGGSNTIYLASTPTTTPVVFDLTAVNNTTNGANGLPVISGASVGKKVAVAADDLTIIGTDPGGDIVQRDSASATPRFRLFDVAQGASLTLENVTLQGGWAFGSGAAADGGGIYNQGTLTLSGAIVEGNFALGSRGAAGSASNGRKSPLPGQPGADAAGGGIWSSGTVTLQDLTQNGTTTPTLLQGNYVSGGWGGVPGSYYGVGGAGGNGFGGGLYEAGGTVNVSNATISGNTAAGGSGGGSLAGVSSGGAGGNGSGGGLYVAGGTLTLSNVTTVASNQALGGAGASSGTGINDNGGQGSGGGISVAAGTVQLDHVELLSNTAQGGAVGSQFGGAGEKSGGAGVGGGLYVANGTVTLTNDQVSGNAAKGGANALGNFPIVGNVPDSGPASAAGIYINSQATVYLDSFTVTNTTQNDDSYDWDLTGWQSYEDDIDGSYTLL